MLSWHWLTGTVGEIQTRDLAIASPSLYHMATSAVWARMGLIILLHYIWPGRLCQLSSATMWDVVQKHGIDVVIDSLARNSTSPARHLVSAASSAGGNAMGGRVVGGKTTAAAAPADGLNGTNRLKVSRVHSPSQPVQLHYSLTH